MSAETATELPAASSPPEQGLGVPRLVRRGWAVAIQRSNGTHFLACSSLGLMPALWPHSQRYWAVAHKKELLAQGFKCRVVPIEFTDVAELETDARWFNPTPMSSHQENAKRASDWSATSC